MAWWSRDSFSRGGGLRVNKESCGQNMEGTVLWGEGGWALGLMGRLQSPWHSEHRCANQVSNTFHPFIALCSYLSKGKHQERLTNTHTYGFLSQVTDQDAGQRRSGQRGSVHLGWGPCNLCLSFLETCLIWASVCTGPDHPPSFPRIVLSLRRCCEIASFCWNLLACTFLRVKFLILSNTISDSVKIWNLYFVEGNWLGIGFRAGLFLQLTVQTSLYCLLPASITNEPSEVWFHSFF